MAIEDIQARLRDFEEGKQDISPDDRGTLRDIRTFISRALQGGDPDSAPVLDRVGKDWALDLLYNRWTSLSEELIRLNHRLQDTYHIHNGPRRRSLLKDSVREIFDPEVEQAYYRRPATDLDEAVFRALRSALVAWVERQGRLSPLLFMERLKELHLLTDEASPRLTSLGRYFVGLDPRKGMTFLLLCDLAVGRLSPAAARSFIKRGRHFDAREETPPEREITLEQAEWLAALGVAESEQFHYLPTPEGRLAFGAALSELGGPWAELATQLASQEYRLERATTVDPAQGELQMHRAGAWYGRTMQQSMQALGLQAQRMERLTDALDAEGAEAEELRRAIAALESDLRKLDAVTQTWVRYTRSGTRIPEIVSAEEVVRGAIAEWSRRDPELSLDVQIEPGLPAVSGDRSDLQAAVVHLLDNAADALEGRDDARVQVTIQGIEGGGRVRLSVSDNGPGIPSRLSRRVFEPGFTSRSGRRGMGLGFVRRVVEFDFQGEIVLSTNVAGGADFTVLLPTVRGLI